MSIVNVLGIDPSLRNTGLIVSEIDLENPTAFKPIYIELSQTEDETGKQVRQSSDDLRCAMEQAQRIRWVANRFKIAAAFAEIPSGAQSARAAFSFGICVGILGDFSLDHTLIQVTPSEVKKASVGRKASKAEITEWAIGKFPDLAWIVSNRKNDWDLQLRGKHVHKDNEHLADAVAATSAGIITTQFRGMLRLGSSSR